MIWKKELDLEQLNKSSVGNLVGHMQIKYTAFDQGSITAIMPAADFTKQPFGIVHGGANCVIAETLGSVAANLCCGENEHAVGQSIQTTHLKAVRNGTITCVGKPIRIGGTVQVWELITYDDSGDKTSFTTLSMAVRRRLS